MKKLLFFLTIIAIAGINTISAGGPTKALESVTDVETGQSHFQCINSGSNCAGVML